jgi:hypothetical protein
MNDLTLAQKKMLSAITCDVPVYVFKNEKGDQTYSYYKDNTCARVYTTLTARSLFSKGLVVVKKCVVEGSLDNCIGVLEVYDETCSHQ